MTISDDQSVQTAEPSPSVLSDSITYGTGHGSNRIYWVNLTATVTLPSVAITLTSFPITQWGMPLQLPGGVDALPPLPMWSWTVLHDGLNDTGNWTVTAWDQQLSRTTTWTNQTYEILGTTDPIVDVSVTPGQADGTNAPGIGFVMNTPGVKGGIPSNQSDFASVASAMHPTLIRFGTDTVALSYTWNTVTDQPKYNFTWFDRLVNFSHQLHSKIFLSLPAGTWGDGNLLPAGMPLNGSLLVQAPAGTGYFPSDGPWQWFVEGVVNHTVAAGSDIAFWNIGNEVPTYNQTEVAAFVHVFNIAERTIHAKLPSTRVGSDVMANRSFEPYFAGHARGVGFLSFHYYPSIGLCVNNGTYCPPQGPPNGSTDAGLFSHSAYQFMGRTYAPDTAQALWHNLTGQWLPVLNSETNLNAIGGSKGTRSIGTDPRIQSLFGASWAANLLVDSAQANVSDLTYFTFSSGWGTPTTLTAAYGGFGFGLTSEAANDTTVRYAPYFALALWNAAFPAGAPGRQTVTSAPSVVAAYSAKNGSNLSVYLVNRVNLSVSIHINVTEGNLTLASVTTLDQHSYHEVYQAAQQRTALEGAGTLTTHPNGPAALSIDGYGVAVARFALAAPGNSSGGTGGAGGGDGNSTGNSTGSSGSGDPPTGGAGLPLNAPLTGWAALSPIEILEFAGCILGSGLVAGVWARFLSSHPFRAARARYRT